jgi:hypothetical protein
VAPRDQPSTSGSETPVALPGDLSCADGEDLALDGQGREFHVTGDCGAVTVHGQALDIEIARATSLALDGQAVVVEVDSDLSALQVSGDANRVEAGGIAAISIAGQGNTVEGSTLGALDISGDDNSVEGDNDPSPSNVSGQGNVVSRR